MATWVWRQFGVAADANCCYACGMESTGRTTLAIAFAGSVLTWAALPPLAIGWLGWVAPVPWLVLVGAAELPGRRPYRMLWLAGFIFWLAAIHWLRLPHPAVYAGWMALSAYLACYLPVFVGLSRVAVHRLRVPLWLAAPVVWTGLELARAHLLTGFLMGSLAHTQVRWPAVIQISDLVGEYGVDFVIITVAACVANCGLKRAGASSTPTVNGAEDRPARQSSDRRLQWRLTPLVPAAVLLATTLGYGHWRLPTDDDVNPQSVRVALIQGNSLADWKSDAAKQQAIMDEYLALSHQAVAQARELDGRPIDLMVWPETMFRTPLRSFDSGYRLPRDVQQSKEEIAAVAERDLANLVEQIGTPVLVGIDRVHFVGSTYRAYNSSVLADRAGRIVGTYDKVHLVMFGEYVPLSAWLPFLKNISSITGSAEPGAGPVALCLDGVCYVPNICYETAIPHVIRHQVATLTKRGRESFLDEKRLPTPFVLVNLTNDAWYWGSSELDMHLACDVFRAVETRTPLVVAANGGISAWIDAFGRVRAQSPRMERDVILADVELRPMTSHYVRFGDWFAGACLICCVVLAIVGWRGRRDSK